MDGAYTSEDQKAPAQLVEKISLGPLIPEPLVGRPIRRVESGDRPVGRNTILQTKLYPSEPFEKYHQIDTDANMEQNWQRLPQKHQVLREDIRNDRLAVTPAGPVPPYRNSPVSEPLPPARTSPESPPIIQHQVEPCYICSYRSDVSCDWYPTNKATCTPCQENGRPCRPFEWMQQRPQHSRCKYCATRVESVAKLPCDGLMPFDTRPCTICKRNGDPCVPVKEAVWLYQLHMGPQIGRDARGDFVRLLSVPAPEV